MGKSFSFKQFTVDNGDCAMRVGTDGTLLGAWARGGEHILDIGTGTGLIALMLAQRYPNASIAAIDIDPVCAEQAQKNADASPWTERIEVVCSSLQCFNSAHRFDAIVSNPPYFVNALIAPDKARATARHAVTLTLGDIFEAATRLLAYDGHISLILPSDSFALATEEATKRSFMLSRRTDVKTTKDKPVSRILLEFSPSTTTTHIDTIVLTDTALFKEFYLDK